MKGARSTFSEKSMVIGSAVAGVSDQPDLAQFREAATLWRHPNCHARFRIVRRRIAERDPLSVPLSVNSRTLRETYELPLPERDEHEPGIARGIGAYRGQPESGLRSIPDRVSVRDGARGGQW